MSKGSSAASGALECRLFLFPPSIPGALFDCTLEAKLLHIRYPRRGQSVQLCTPFRNYFKYFLLRDAKMESDEARREPLHQSNRHEIIMAVDPSPQGERRSMHRKGSDASSKKDA